MSVFPVNKMYVRASQYTGMVVRFTDTTSGEVVISTHHSFPVGYKSDNWTRVDQVEYWVDYKSDNWTRVDQVEYWVDYGNPIVKDFLDDDLFNIE